MRPNTNKSGSVRNSRRPRQNGSAANVATRSQTPLEPARNRPSTGREPNFRPGVPPIEKKTKSSLLARRLIRAALKRCDGNQRRAARLLRLPNHAQLRKMLKGEIADTPAMKAALLRAKARAERAFYLQRADDLHQINPEQLRAIMQEIKKLIAVVDEMLRVHDSREAPGT